VIICTRCGKENQDQHKFCLRCGAELGAAGAPAGAPPAAPPMSPPSDGGAAMAKTMMADPGQLPAQTSGQPAAPFGGAPFIAPTPFSPPGANALPLPGMPPAAPGLPASKPKSSPGGMPSPLSVTPPPSIGGPPGPPPPLPFGMQSAASLPASPGAPASPFGAPPPAPFGAPPPGPSPFASPPPFGASGSTTPKNPFAAQPGTGVGLSPAPVAPSPVATPCPSCGSIVPPGFKFCGVCGHKLEAAPPPAPAPAPVAEPSEPAPAARLQGRMTLIRPDGSEGGTHDIGEGTNRLGRTAGPVFENDGYLSPEHAEIVLEASGALVRDQGSLNGVFVKMSGEEEIQPGDVFRIGQELMRFDTIAPPTPLEDGTEIMGSPNPGYWGRISVIIGKDIDGSAFPLLGDAVTLGRERGDINFPDDGYVSGLHARLSTRNGRYYLADLGSSNGTFIKLHGERTIEPGAFVLLGQQLFRVNFG
jgi:pSer/pThr/pTyr-binding forkhead associated (FHA) protein